ncbi:MAG: hypothetical protein HKO65_14210 [Gemmatimonadetes bacterium]|nr:transporter [Gemmatimonadota bacterium]NNM06240.1 hypothetical protein [Gemmatimonadota bacterium]
MISQERAEGKKAKNRPGPLWTACLIAILTPIHLSGQAICSAPHSSPTLAQSGSLRTLPKGAGWIQVAAYGQRATDFFDPNGDRQAFLADSQFDTRSLFFTGAIGIVEGVELWAQVPVHNLNVESLGGDSRTSGLGDLRVAARFGSELLNLDIPLSLRLGAKIPGSDFPVDATVLPLTEGQRDWEASLEAGFSLPDRSEYLMGWVGYRWREANKEAAREPGDELFASLSVGGTVGTVSWGLTADALWGGVPLAQGFELPGDKRRLIQVLPTIGRRVGPGHLEVTGQLPVSGQNLPVGLGISLGYRLSWGLDPEPLTDLRDFFRG